MKYHIHQVLEVAFIRFWGSCINYVLGKQINWELVCIAKFISDEYVLQCVRQTAAAHLACFVLMKDVFQQLKMTNPVKTTFVLTRVSAHQLAL